MKNALLFITITTLCFLGQLSAQDCNPPTSLTKIDGNNIRAMHGIGDLWFDGARASFEFPKAETGLPAVHAFGGAGFWFSGTDPLGNVKVSAQTYERAQGRTSFWAGPGGQDYCQAFNFIFRVTEEDMNQFLNDLSDGSIDQEIPPNILIWPGRGNPHFEDFFGLPMPESSAGFAEFFDRDQDGIYDPMNGDLPLTYGAEEVNYWLMNDFSGITNFDPLKIILSVHAYSFKDENDAALNNSVFYNVNATNMNPSMIEGFTFSLWYDPALGCPVDDYQGCIPEKDLAFVYNEDEIDGLNGAQCSQGFNTYASSIPVMGIKFIEGGLFIQDGEVMNSHVVYNESLELDPNLSTPTLAAEHYHMMNGLDKLGNPIIQNEQETTYMYAGNPSNGDPEEAWTMCTEETSLEERKVLTSFKPIDLNAGAVVNYQFVVTGQLDVAHPCPDVSGLIESTDRLKEFWFDNQLSWLLNSDQKLAQGRFNVFPNPATDQVTIKLENTNELIESVDIMDAFGRQIKRLNSLHTDHLTLDLDHLPKGINFIRIETSSGKFLTEKLCIQ